jgi:hypothetical protein
MNRLIIFDGVKAKWETGANDDKIGIHFIVNPPHNKWEYSVTDLALF